MRYTAIILAATLALLMAAGTARGQAASPFEWPPTVRAPTDEEARAARANVREASAAYGRGDLSGASAQYLAVLELLHRTYGRYHPFTLEVSGGYATVQSMAGNYEVARPIQELVARGLMDYYGEDDPGARAALSELAVTYRSMGETDRAVRILMWMVNKDLDNPALSPTATLPQLLDLTATLVSADR